MVTTTMTTTDYFNSIQLNVAIIPSDVVNKIVKIWQNEYQEQVGSGRRVFIIGNGGSCAIAEHISTDLNKRCNVKALTLSNNSLLTALTNDYGHDQALVEWMKINHFGKTDFLVAISSSGKSKNILRALEYAATWAASTFSIFGMNGKSIFPQYNENHNYIHIDSHNYGIIELVSEIILHGIVEELVVE